MVAKLAETPSVRLLKHVVRCYLRFSEQQKSRNALKKCLPNSLKDQTFAVVLRSEESVQKWLQQLLKNISLLPSDTTNFSQNPPQVANNSNQNPQLSFQGASLSGAPVASYQSRIAGANSVGGTVPNSAPPVQIGQSFGLPSAPGWHQQSSS